MSELEQSRMSFKKALEGLDDGRALTLGSYPGKLIARVEELEEIKSFLGKQMQAYDQLVDINRNKASRYKQALEFYADEENYFQSFHDKEIGYPPEIINENGFKARQALKEADGNEGN